MKALAMFALLGIGFTFGIEDAAIFQTQSESVAFLHRYSSEPHLEERHVTFYTRDPEAGQQNEGTCYKHGLCTGSLSTKNNVKKRSRPVIRLIRTRHYPPGCDSSPCRNEGICKNVGSYDFSCDCTEGYTGTVCEEDIDECASNPCQNGATCNDFVNRYTCSCDAGYTDTHCKTDIDECASNPCQNGATCNDHVNGYTCSCDEDYIGSHCETDTCYPSGGADVAIIVDASESQGQGNFERMRAFLKSLVSAFRIGVSDFRISVMSVSTNNTVHFGLNTHLTNDSLLQAIDTIPYTGGASELHVAMETVRNEVFNVNGTKPKYVIVLHDGMVSSPSALQTEVGLLKGSGVSMVSVGFGDQILHQGLIDTATDFRHVFSPVTDDLQQWLHRRHAMDECPDCAVKSADVFLLLEASFNSSDSDESTKYSDLLDALKEIVSRTPISTTSVHFSGAKFNDTVTEQFDFVTHFSYSGIRSYFAKDKQLSGTSNHTKALNHIRSNVFTSANGYRVGSRKVAILFISEEITELTSVLEQAEALKADGVTIVVVAAFLPDTKRIDISAVRQIVSDPAYLYVQGHSVYGDRSSLDALQSQLQYNECVFD